MNSLDLEGIELGKQLNIVVSSIDELSDKLEDMGLMLGMDPSGSWVVLNTEKEVLAKVE
jgi:hypothetical protein